MTPPRIAVLHHHDAFLPLDLAQHSRGIADLVWVLDDGIEDDPRLTRLLGRLGDVVVITELDDDAAAARVADASADGIVTFAESRIRRAAEVAQRLGLRYHSPALARILTDKALQREALAGIPGASSFEVVPAGATAEQVAAIVGRVGLPAVLKPRMGTGSVGIRLVNEVADLGDVVGAPDAHLLEEYLPDRDDLPSWAASYLSVESVVADGVVHHVALTGRFPTASRFRETGNFIPAAIDDEMRVEVLALTDRIIVTLGIRDSVLHTEIKLTPDGPRLIEINGRLGARPGFVLSEVSEVDLKAVAFRVAAGLPVELDGPAALSGVGFWIMIQPPEDAERVAALNGLDELRSRPEVHLLDVGRGPGEKVDWRDGTGAHILSIRGAAPDHVALGHLMAAVEGTLRVEYA